MRSGLKKGFFYNYNIFFLYCQARSAGFTLLDWPYRVNPVGGAGVFGKFWRI